MNEREFYPSPEAPEIMVIALTGRLDNAVAEPLMTRIEHSDQAEKIGYIFDCGKLEHIGSEGLGVMIRVKSRLKNSNRTMVLANVSGKIAEILQIVHFDRVFDIYPNCEAAVSALRAES